MWGPSPAAALAEALAVSPEELSIRTPRAGPTCERPDPQSLAEREEAKTVFLKDPPAAVSPEYRIKDRAIPAPRRPPPKPLSFAAMLREDEGEGVLLTELACQSGWGPTNMLPQRALH